MTRRFLVAGNWPFAAAGLAVLAVGAAVQAQSAPQAVGIAAAVVNEVKLSNAQNSRPRQVAPRQRLALADLIQTGKASQLQILLLDRSTFSIGANAAVRIDRFVYDPARGRAFGSTVVKGAFRFMSGQPNRQNTATIGTPVATIGIRGTILDGVIGEEARKIAREELREAKDAKADDKTATLIVLRGPGPQTDPRVYPGAATLTVGDRIVELNGPTQAVYIPKAGAAPIGPFTISPGGLAQLSDLVQPALAPPKGGGLLGGLLSALPVVTTVLGGKKGGGSGQQQPNPDPAGKP